MTNNVELILGHRHKYFVYSNKFLFIRHVSNSPFRDFFIHDFIDTNDKYFDYFLKRNNLKIHDTFILDDSVKYLPTSIYVGSYIFEHTPNNSRTLLENDWKYDSFIKLSKYKHLLMESVSRFYDENGKINEHSEHLMFIKDLNDKPILVSTSMDELNEMKTRFYKSPLDNKLKLTAYDGSEFKTLIGNVILSTHGKMFIDYKISDPAIFNLYINLLYTIYVARDLDELSKINTMIGVSR